VDQAARWLPAAWRHCRWLFNRHRDRRNQRPAARADPERYGLCRGWTVDDDKERTRGEREGEGGDERARLGASKDSDKKNEDDKKDDKKAPAPDLTGYLHTSIQALAGRDPLDDAPLTFKDLWDAPGGPTDTLGYPGNTLERRSINLEVYAPAARATYRFRRRGRGMGGTVSTNWRITEGRAAAFDGVFEALRAKSGDQVGPESRSAQRWTTRATARPATDRRRSAAGDELSAADLRRAAVGDRLRADI
jgi:hypothetical protein